MCLNVKQINKSGTYKADTIGGKEGDSYNISTWQKCGHCAECAAEKANNWVVRNHYEAKKHKRKCFITLTYAKNPRILIKKDLQDFIKRLRHHLGKIDIKIRYFGCGEYGTKRGRPHYHLIIYGWEDPTKKFVEWNKKGKAIYNSDIIAKTWGKGRTSYQDFDDKAIPYVSLYTAVNDNMYAPKIKIEALQKELSKTKNAQRAKYLENRIRKAEETKSKYYAVKEFCLWSQGLGFDTWIKEHDGQTWTEYVGDFEIMTPSPWIKKIGAMGEAGAIAEMIDRKNYEIDRAETAESRAQRKAAKAREKDREKLLKWQKDKHITEDF